MEIEQVKNLNDGNPGNIHENSNLSPLQGRRLHGKME